MVDSPSLIRASFDSRFGHPDVNLRYRLEAMIDELECGPNPGLRAFMLKMGWQPPTSGAGRERISSTTRASRYTDYAATQQEVVISLT